MPTQEDKSKFNKALTLLMSKANLSAAAVARNCGIPESTIRRLRNEENSNPTASILVSLSTFFNVTVDQLLGITPLPENDLIGGYKQKIELWTQLPLISWEDATVWPNIETNSLKTTSTDINIEGQAFSLTIKDNNEYEGFLSGSVLIVDPNANPKHKDYVIAQKENQPKASLKQLLIHEGDLYLDPLKRNFKIVSLNDQYRMIGVVVQTKVDLT